MRRDAGHELPAGDALLFLYCGSRWLSPPGSELEEQRPRVRASLVFQHKILLVFCNVLFTQWAANPEPCLTLDSLGGCQQKVILRQNMSNDVYGTFCVEPTGQTNGQLRLGWKIKTNLSKNIQFSLKEAVLTFTLS